MKFKLENNMVLFNGECVDAYNIMLDLFRANQIKAHYEILKKNTPSGAVLPDMPDLFLGQKVEIDYSFLKMMRMRDREDFNYEIVAHNRGGKTIIRLYRKPNKNLEEWEKEICPILSSIKQQDGV